MWRKVITIYSSILAPSGSSEGRKYMLQGRADRLFMNSTVYIVIGPDPWI